MLIHSNRRWKSSVNAHLRPYAVRMASDQVNVMPNMQRDDRRTPLQVFTRTNIHGNMKHWHHFGSPVFVLDQDLQTNTPFGNWKSRAKIGIYLGRSLQHSRNVALVLSMLTGLVSPQFHVRHDSTFFTIKEEKQDTPAFWMVKAGFAGVKEDSSDRGSKQPARGGKSQAGKQKTAKNSRQQDRERLSHGSGAGVAPPGNDTASWLTLPPVPPQNEEAGPQPPFPNPFKDTNVQMSETTNMNQNEPEEPNWEPPQTQIPVVTTRSGRMSKANPRYIEAMLVQAMVTDVKGMGGDVEGEIFFYKALFPDSGLDNSDPLMIYKATTDPDTMYMHQAMREPDQDEFKKAMIKEVTDQMANGNFSIVKRTDIPTGQMIMPTVWQMKRKLRLRPGVPASTDREDPLHGNTKGI
jgi:hypothetical protein